MNGEAAYRLVIDLYGDQIETVLDVGCGKGQAAERFVSAGKRVVGVTLPNHRGVWPTAIVGDYLTTPIGPRVDLAWCCHALEHQVNPGLWLGKLLDDVKLGGLAAIIVPGARRDVANGHVLQWTAGTLLYMLAVCGFDCSEAHVLEDTHDLSVVCRAGVRGTTCEVGSIVELRDYLPMQWITAGCPQDWGPFNWPEEEGET